MLTVANFVFFSLLILVVLFTPASAASASGFQIGSKPSCFSSVASASFSDQLCFSLFQQSGFGLWFASVQTRQRCRHTAAQHCDAISAHTVFLAVLCVGCAVGFRDATISCHWCGQLAIFALLFSPLGFIVIIRKRFVCVCSTSRVSFTVSAADSTTAAWYPVYSASMESWLPDSVFVYV